MQATWRTCSVAYRSIRWTARLGRIIARNRHLLLTRARRGLPLQGMKRPWCSGWHLANLWQAQSGAPIAANGAQVRRAAQELVASNVGGQQAAHDGTRLPQVDGADDTQVLLFCTLYPGTCSPNRSRSSLCNGMKHLRPFTGNSHA